MTFDISKVSSLLDEYMELREQFEVEEIIEKLLEVKMMWLCLGDTGESREKIAKLILEVTDLELSMV